MFSGSVGSVCVAISSVSPGAVCVAMSTEVTTHTSVVDITFASSVRLKALWQSLPEIHKTCMK
jgi:hypothetical protein